MSLFGGIESEQWKNKNNDNNNWEKIIDQIKMSYV